MDRVNTGALIMLGAVFISALLIGGIFFYGIFFFATFLLVFSYYTGRKAYEAMECIIWKNSDKVTTGSSLDYSVEIYNSSIFRIPYLEVYTSLPRRLTGELEKCTVKALAPESKAKITNNFVCRHKGIYNLGLVEVIYSDPFLIFKWKKQFSDDISLTVYPQIYPIESINIPANQLFGTLSKENNAFEDFTSIKDIRKYQNGDSYKKIHWKVSAHRGELYVKNLDMNASTQMHLFLDLFEENYKREHGADIEEKAAELTASLLNYAMSKGIGINLYAMGHEYINLSDKEAGQLSTFMNVLASLQPQGAISISQLIYKEARKLNNGVTIIVITSEVNCELVEMANQLKHKGFKFILFEIKDRSKKRQEFDSQIPNYISYYSINLDEEPCKVVRDRYAYV